MQYKALATLLFATAALAVPASDVTTSDDWLDNIGLPIETESIPSGILSVIETAIPSTWAQALETDSAFQSSVLNDILHSTYPAWYNSLPDSVKSWATAEGDAEVSALSSYYSVQPTVTPTAGSSAAAGSSSHASSTPLTTGHSSTLTSTPLTSTSTATQITSLSSTSSTTSSTSRSGTSTSTAGAPAATGGLAFGLAGAAGVLGLALAL
ncbi:hypothetical protein F1880_007159 [Penicillium rolfsii]|nr:hypothetical protein F1880_007159 [Penicillium rolfsii]